MNVCQAKEMFCNISAVCAACRRIRCWCMTTADLFLRLSREPHLEEVEEVRGAVVREWQMGLMERGLQAATVRKNLSALRSWFKYLRREKIVQEDVMGKVVSPKLPKHLPIFFRESETARLYDRANFPEGFAGDRDQLLLRLLYETGMRCGELVALQEGSVDMSALTIKVIGKRDKERYIPMENELSQNIRCYLTQNRQR